MTNEALFRLFSKFGNVISARIMVEKATGRSRGFGKNIQNTILDVRMKFLVMSGGSFLELKYDNFRSIFVF